MSRVKKTAKLTANLITKALRLLLVLVLLLAAFVVYEVLIDELIRGDAFFVPFLLVWAFTAYIVLPRIHRFFTKVYLPDYFVGRTRTADGFYGDPVNLALIGPERKLHQALEAAGWHRAEDLSFRSAVKMSVSSVFKKSYKTAPVSPLFLFNKKQDFAYQREINNNPRARHHVRFWKTPSGWWLPGGYKADWLASATYDKSVGFSTLTGQITHKIAEKTDIERDFLVRTVRKTGLTKEVKYIRHFTSSFRDRNGGGDRIETDGALPFVHFK